MNMMGENSKTGATAIGNGDIRGMLGALADVLDQSDVVEISCNATQEVWVERFGDAPRLWGRMPPGDTDRFLRWCATWSCDVIRDDQPIFSGRIPGLPHRIEGLIPPVVEAPVFSIRRHRDQVVGLAAFVGNPGACDLIARAVGERKNILIAGATGSGKTTLLNACLEHLAEIEPDTRLITIEDTPEIRTNLKNALALRSSRTVTMDRLLVSSLRLSPDRIVVGEVRSGSVLMTLIKAWNTGHPGGLVTLHANAASQVMPRLSMLAQEVTENEPVAALRHSLDTIIFVRRGRDRPVVETIASMGDLNVEVLYEQGSL